MKSIFLFFFPFLPFSLAGPIQLLFSIKEELPRNSVVGNILKNSTRNFALRIIPKPKSNAGLLFRIHENGDLRTRSRIDRDEICPRQEKCDIEMDIFDRTVFYKVIVEIKDKNDNKPKFTENSTTFFVSEATGPGFSISLPAAQDNDSPKYGIKKYEIPDLRKKYFEFTWRRLEDGTDDLKLLLKRKLDRERKEKYNMVLKAIDGSGKSDSLKILIIVTDANDNIAVFEDQHYEGEVLENSPKGTSVLQVIARDEDLGPNAEIDYFIVSSDYLPFEIDESGVIKVKGSIDYEENHSYEFSVRARDRGPDPLSSIASVKIKVLDENDCTPKIHVKTLQVDNSFATMEENRPEKNFIAFVTVEDPDSGKGGEVECDLKDNKSHFLLKKIIPKEYKLVNKSPLNREDPRFDDKGEIGIVILCKDLGKNPNIGSSFVLLKVLDQNESPPVFKDSEVFKAIQENQGKGKLLVEIEANDPDGNDRNLSFRFKNKRFEKYLELKEDGNRAKIYTKVSLDHEETPELHVKVEACDQGGKCDVCTIHIQIQDLNDNYPEFRENFYNFSVLENQKSSLFVGKVNAFDRDSKSLNEFCLKLKGEKDYHFKIDKNGTIRTARKLDREKISVYHLSVYALPDTCNFLPTAPGVRKAIVEIWILDENDHSPEFKWPASSSYTISVNPDSRVNKVVASLVASDKDTGLNSKIQYELLSDKPAGFFQLNPFTGVVKLAKSLETFENGAVIKFIVKASDMGEKSLSSEERTLNFMVNRTSSGEFFGEIWNTYVLWVIIGLGILGAILLVACFALIRRGRKRSDEVDEGSPVKERMLAVKDVHYVPKDKARTGTAITYNQHGSES
ncbi:DgyrCDS12035 [Dimorphilus gyrociliatus]|uniref:DgyrCDS12035 n=1 Tax=Dimorphilus gyrociliatus TaxID=2664684 RepID=A0A7I8W6B5_9ANNE|nr:DgyrCDS12035 [Dimorphilus gyrociliatus]